MVIEKDVSSNRIQSTYSEVILSDIEFLPGFILGVDCLNNIRYEDYRVGTYTKRKVHNFLQKVVTESQKKAVWNIGEES